MKRGSYQKVSLKNSSLLQRIRELKSDHPFWEYRRIWAHIRYVDGLFLGKKPGVSFDETGITFSFQKHEIKSHSSGSHHKAQTHPPQSVVGH